MISLGAFNSKGKRTEFKTVLAIDSYLWELVVHTAMAIVDNPI